MKKTKMLKKNYEFKRVLSKGTYYSGRLIEAYILKARRNQAINYLGLAISVKTGKAVNRNYLKRLLRENYSCMELNLKSGNQIVFLWKKKKPIEEADFDKIRQDMEKIFDKAKILDREESQ